MAKENVNALEAKQGEKMIEIKVRFWTDKIASEPGKVIPKHGWTSGVVRIETNKTHGIKAANPRPFNSLLDVGAIIEEVLIEHGVILQPSRRMQKFLRAKT